MELTTRINLYNNNTNHTNTNDNHISFRAQNLFSSPRVTPTQATQNFQNFLSIASNDLFRFEDGSGDARIPLHVGDDEPVCSLGYNSSAAPAARRASSVLENNELENTNSQLCEIDFLSASSDKKTKEQEVQVDEDNLDSYTTGWSSGSFIARLPSIIRIGQEQYVIQPDTVFVFGMRSNVTKNDIMIFFGKIGRIKMDEANCKPKIFVYKNKLTGRSKGEATITYQNPHSAQAAIKYLTGTKFMSNEVTVQQAYLCSRGSSVRYTYLHEPGVEQQRRQRKWRPAADNWICQQCKNSNFSWRVNCNRCLAKKSEMVRAVKRPWRQLKNDWPCDYCFNINFWYRVNCNRCGACKIEENKLNDKKILKKPEKWELGSQSSAN